METSGHSRTLHNRGSAAVTDEHRIESVLPTPSASLRAGSLKTTKGGATSVVALQAEKAKGWASRPRGRGRLPSCGECGACGGASLFFSGRRNVSSLTHTYSD